MDRIAVWDWEREPVPDARIVVIRDLPRCYQTDAQGLAEKHLGNGRLIILASDAWIGAEEPTNGVIRALYAERQADLARLPNLLALKADRRALVLCPRDAIDLGADIRSYIDWALIIPPTWARRAYRKGRGYGAPWTMHPGWVRGIVEQCRAAGVPCCFLGWGPEGAPWQHAGRLLDGAEVMDVPEWAESLA